MKFIFLIFFNFIFLSCEEKLVEVGGEEIAEVDQRPEEEIIAVEDEVLIEEKIEIDEKCLRPISDTKVVNNVRELGIFKIINQEMYMSLSGIDKNGNGLADESANTYIFKGLTREGLTKIHLFGAGYGDPNTGIPDLRPGQDSITPNSVTAGDIDLVITSCMGLKKENVEIDFITPHFHNDHINQGLFNELNKLGYDLHNMSINIHVKDYEPLFNIRAEGYIPWEPATLAQFVLIGANSNCGEIAMSFETNKGRWDVYNNPGHTNGSVYLKNELYSMAITGAPYMQCPVPTVDFYFHVHGNISFEDDPKTIKTRSGMLLAHDHNH